MEKVQLHVRVDGRPYKAPATLNYIAGRIEFHDAAFVLKDEIKAMAGRKWHGYDDPTKKYWSVDDSPRNRFQLAYMKGEPVYDWFDQPIKQHLYERELFPHQKEMADHFLTYHFGIMAAEMGTGKTLALQEIMEHSRRSNWWWVGPKNSLGNIKREFQRWNIDPTLHVDMMSYDALQGRMEKWKQGLASFDVPDGVIFDEASKLKNHETLRSEAAQDIADKIRARYGHDGYVVLASGTPSPACPADWWSLCEIAYPGFLKEGDEKALKKRLGIAVKKEFAAGVFEKIVTWRDNPEKCDKCGDWADAPQHATLEAINELRRTGGSPDELHVYTPSFNEISYLHERLKGLVIVKRKKDVLAHLPDKRYRKVYCEPSPSILRAARVLAGSATNAMTGFADVRELSDGFQYREKFEGTTKCKVCATTGEISEWYLPSDERHVFRQIDLLDPEFVASLAKRTVVCPGCQGSGHMPKKVRETIEVPCPKDQALKDLLEENEEVGRIVIFAGYDGSIARILNLCKKKKWATVRCDGSGLTVYDDSGKTVTGVEPLAYWSDLAKNAFVAWVANPESGGVSFTLTEARMAVFWSNSYKPEFRSQAEDRIHRPGMDENKGCEIVDLIHLPSDEKALVTVKENRRLELMTLGDLTACFAIAA